METKAERREQRRTNVRKMRMSGKGTRLLQEIIMKKSGNTVLPY